MNEDKATRYHRRKRWVSVASLAWGLLLLVGLLVSGWSHALREAGAGLALAVAGPPPADSLVTRSAYLVLVGLMNELVALPLAFYSGYLLEHRYGLSTQGVGHWAAERAKGLAIGGPVALVAVNLLYLAIDRWPDAWWVVAGLGVAVVVILITAVFPVVLLPLFYRVTPIARPDLRSRLLELAARARIKAVDAYEWRVSDRTRKANAALTGLGRTRRILVSDTMLSEYSDEEVEVVLAHEIAHHVHRDIWKGVAFEAALSLAGLYVAARLLVALAPVVGLRGPGDVAGLPLLLLAVTAVSLVLLPVANALSRSHERRADRYALALTRNPTAFISAMRRLASQNLAEEQPSPLVRLLFYTHPPVSERIAAARQG